MGCMSRLLFHENSLLNVKMKSIFKMKKFKMKIICNTVRNWSG